MDPEKLLAKLMHSGVIFLEGRLLTDYEQYKELWLTEEEADYLRSLRVQD